MKREDSVLVHIPAGYEVWDVDLAPDGEAVCVLANQSGEQPLLMVGGDVAPIPSEAIFERDLFIFAPAARWAGSNQLALVGASTTRDDTNAVHLDRTGLVLRTFHVGSATDVLANDRWIVTTYSDQGIFGDDPVCKQGLTISDLSIGSQAGYADLVGKAAVEIWDSYCACWAGENELVFCPYGQPNFALVRLNLSDMSQQIWSTPDHLHGSVALTTAGDLVFFYSPFDSPTKIFRWEIGANAFEQVGEYNEPQRPSHKYPSVRGLFGGRFIVSNPDGYTILSFD